MDAVDATKVSLIGTVPGTMPICCASFGFKLAIAVSHAPSTVSNAAYHVLAMPENMAHPSVRAGQRVARQDVMSSARLSLDQIGNRRCLNESNKKPSRMLVMDSRALGVS